MRKPIGYLALGAVALMAAPSFAAVPTAQPAATHYAAKPAKPAQTTSATRMVKTAHASSVRTAALGGHPAGRMVKARLANGKTVIYNCSLPGNAQKTACRR